MSFNLTSPISANGVAVPIYATFTGHAKMPFWWAISTNSANPKLRLFEDELKVIKSHRKSYSHVAVADAYCGLVKTNNLILTWNDTPWTFTANIIQRNWLNQTLEFLARKNIALSPRVYSTNRNHESARRHRS